MIRIPRVKPVEKKAREKEKPKEECCIKCKHGSFDKKFLNLDIYGNPTLIICPFEKFKRILSDKCCNKHYEAK